MVPTRHGLGALLLEHGTHLNDARPNLDLETHLTADTNPDSYPDPDAKPESTSKPGSGNSSDLSGSGGGGACLDAATLDSNPKPNLNANSNPNPSRPGTLLIAEAARYFREDLRQHPNNVWALVGLKGCLSAIEQRGGGDDGGNGGDGDDGDEQAIGGACGGDSDGGLLAVAATTALQPRCPDTIAGAEAQDVDKRLRLVGSGYHTPSTRAPHAYTHTTTNKHTCIDTVMYPHTNTVRPTHTQAKKPYDHTSTHSYPHLHAYSLVFNKIIIGVID